MKYDFDTMIDRAAFGAGKWKVPEGTIPMTVADMDLGLAPEIIEAVVTAARQGESGYVGMTGDDINAVIEWVKYRNGIDIPRDHLVCTPGVLYSARTAMYALTNEGDKVVIQTPLHTPSMATAAMLGRIPVRNEMIYENGTYRMDFDNLEQCFRDGAKVLMMCAPNNPTGRVWTQKELETVGEIVARYGGYVVSDEIHRDIIHKGKHISPTEIPSLYDRSVAVFSTSKSFNMGGFHIGSAIIPNADIRKKFVDRFYAHGHSCSRPSIMCMRAQTAAYRHGREWFEEMLAYIQANIKLAREYLDGLPIYANDPEGTFLLWVDISELKWNSQKLRDVMRNEWRVLFDPGCYYDTTEYATYTGLEHHVRMNLATQRSTVEEAMDRIRKYFRS